MMRASAASAIRSVTPGGRASNEIARSAGSSRNSRGVPSTLRSSTREKANVGRTQQRSRFDLAEGRLGERTIRRENAFVELAQDPAHRPRHVDATFGGERPDVGERRDVMPCLGLPTVGDVHSQHCAGGKQAPCLLVGRLRCVLDAGDSNGDGRSQPTSEFLTRNSRASRSVGANPYHRVWPATRAGSKVLVVWLSSRAISSARSSPAGPSNADASTSFGAE